MESIKQILKSVPLIRKVFYGLMKMHPYQVIFRRNLKSVKMFDLKNGTDFGGRLYWDEVGTTRDKANDYSPSPVGLFNTLRKMDISKNDKIVDMGCGKGFAMYIMSKYDFGKIGGWSFPKICVILQNII